MTKANSNKQLYENYFCSNMYISQILYQPNQHDLNYHSVPDYGFYD